MESRNSYGYGYVGSNKKGFEWRLIWGDKAHQKMRSGIVYKTERERRWQQVKSFKSKAHMSLIKMAR